MNADDGDEGLEISVRREGFERGFVSREMLDERKQRRQERRRRPLRPLDRELQFWGNFAGRSTHT